MTGKEFKKLTEGTEIVTTDNKHYTVIDTDSMGRIQMVKLCYHIDDWEEADEEFDTPDEANDYLSTRINQVKEDVEDLEHQLSDCDDDECRGEIQEDLDNRQELLEQLECADIESEESGKLFWMHYKDVEDEDIIYSYEQD